MNEFTIYKHRKRSTKFNLGPLRPDDRLAFTRRVCEILVESRFGAVAIYEPLDELSTIPCIHDETDFEGEFNACPLPQIFRLNQAAHQASNMAASQYDQTHRLDHRYRTTQPFSPAAPGRGSPGLSLWSAQGRV